MGIVNVTCIFMILCSRDVLNLCGRPKRLELTLKLSSICTSCRTDGTKPVILCG